MWKYSVSALAWHLSCTTKLIMRGTPDPEVKVLSISPTESDAVALRRILSHTAWSLEEARTLAEALGKLAENPAPVILCNYRLADGSWRDVLAETSKLPHRPQLIVASPLPEDKLWMEVLDSGAYDLVVKPFKADDVFRIISLAWLHWKQQRKQRARPAHATEIREGRGQPAFTTHTAHH